MAFEIPVGWLMHLIDVKTRGKVAAVRKKKRGHGGSFAFCKYTTFDSGPGARATGRDPSRGVSQFPCSGAAGRGAGVQEILAGGAPQHSRRGVFGDVSVNRLHREWNLDNSRWVRRDHAAESFAAGDCRAVWHAGIAFSGTH